MYNNLPVVRMTFITRVKLQISKFQAEKSCQVGFKMLWWLYSYAFVKRVNSSVHFAYCMYVIHCRSKLPMDYFDQIKGMACLFLL
jgi:hypothetical protein